MPCWLPVLCGGFEEVLPGACVGGACEWALGSLSRVLWFLECVRPHPAMWCPRRGFMAAAVGAAAHSCAPVGPCLWAWFVPLWNVLSQLLSGPRWHDVALAGAAPAWLLWLVCLAELEGEGWEGVRVARLDPCSVARPLPAGSVRPGGRPVPLRQLGLWKAARA